MSIRTSAALLAMATSAAGCAAQAPPPQLESLRVEVTSTTAAAEDGFAITGLLAVDGDGRDYRLRVEGDDQLELILHLPGESDLTILDGRTVTVELTGASYSASDRGVAVYDGSGLVFLAQSSWDDRLSAAWFGGDFVDWGESLYQERSQGRTVSYTTAVFDTEAGSVTLLPGEADALTLRGASWRAVVNAAWRVDDDGLFDTACAGPGDLLSFELLRPDEPPQDVPDVLVAESRRALAADCQ